MLPVSKYQSLCSIIKSDRLMLLFVCPFKIALSVYNIMSRPRLIRRSHTSYYSEEHAYYLNGSPKCSMYVCLSFAFERYPEAIPTRR